MTSITDDDADYVRRKNFKRYHPIPGELITWVTEHQTCTYTLPLLLKIMDTADVHTFELSTLARKSINLSRLARQWHCHKRSMQRAMSELIEMKLVANYVFRSGYRNVKFVLTFDFHNFDSGYCTIPEVCQLADFYEIVAKGQKKKPPFTPLEPRLAVFSTPKVINKDINKVVNSCGYSVDNLDQGTMTAPLKCPEVSLESAPLGTPYIDDYIQDYITYDLLSSSRARERFGRSRLQAWAETVRHRGVTTFGPVEWYYHELLASADFHGAFCTWLHPVLPASSQAYDRMSAEAWSIYQTKLDDVVALGWQASFRPDILTCALATAGMVGGDIDALRQALYDFTTSAQLQQCAETKHRLYPELFTSVEDAIRMTDPVKLVFKPQIETGTLQVAYDMKCLLSAATPASWPAPLWVDHLRTFCQTSLPSWRVLCEGDLSEYNDVLLHKEHIS